MNKNFNNFFKYMNNALLNNSKQEKSVNRSSNQSRSKSKGTSVEGHHPKLSNDNNANFAK